MEGWRPPNKLQAKISIAVDVDFGLPLNDFYRATCHFDEEVKTYVQSEEKNMPFTVTIPPNMVTYFMEWITWWLSPSQTMTEAQVARLRPFIDEMEFCTDKRGYDRDIQSMASVTAYDSEPDFPCDSYPTCEVSHRDLLLDEFVDGKRYHRCERYKQGYYYDCADESCRGRLYLTAEKKRIIRDHSEECENTVIEIGAYQEDQWIAIEEYIADRAQEGWTTASIILDIAENHKEMKAIFSMGYRGIARLVKKYAISESENSSTPLEELIGLEHMIRYQEVYPDRMVVIASDESVRLATTATWILIDGTFKTSPPGFKQMITLLGRDQEDEKGLFFPVCHVLLTNKREETYKRMFEVLDICISLPELQVITTDFEKGLLNSVRDWQTRSYPETTLRGCRFHFTQCLLRKYMKFHGRSLSTEQWAFIRIMMWTCFLDNDTINAMINVLESFKCNESQFLAYYRRQWMGSDFSLWNLHDIDPDDIVTTNNAIESFHSVLDDGLPKGPTIERLTWFLNNYTSKASERIELQNRENPNRKHIIRPTRDEILFRFRELISSYEMESTELDNSFYETLEFSKDEISQLEDLRKEVLASVSKAHSRPRCFVPQGPRPIQIVPQSTPAQMFPWPMQCVYYMQ